MDAITLRSFVNLSVQRDLFVSPDHAPRPFLEPKTLAAEPPNVSMVNSSSSTPSGAGGGVAAKAAGLFAKALGDKKKRRSIVAMEAKPTEGTERVVNTSKTEEVATLLAAALRQNFLFRNLDDTLMEEVCVKHRSPGLVTLRGPTLIPPCCSEVDPSSSNPIMNPM